MTPLAASKRAMKTRHALWKHSHTNVRFKMRKFRYELSFASFHTGMQCGAAKRLQAGAILNHRTSGSPYSSILTNKCNKPLKILMCYMKYSAFLPCCTKKGDLGEERAKADGVVRQKAASSKTRKCSHAKIMKSRSGTGFAGRAGHPRQAYMRKRLPPLARNRARDPK